MASLTGQTIASSYDALLKVTDNGPLTSSLKLITDGLGNNSALSLSTVSASITGTLAVSSTLSASNFSGTSSNTNTGDETNATIKSKLGAATTSVDGYLTSTDWTTFNNKVATTRSISTTAPLSGGGDLSANRTLSISQATTSTDGYLSSTNWNTFNGKIGGSGTTANIPLFNSSNTITNSLITQAGSVVGIDSGSATFGVGYLGDGDYTFKVIAGGATTIYSGLAIQGGGIGINAGGLSVIGGINNNNGGITNAGALSGSTTIAMGGALSGATNITGSGKLSIADIGASGTLNVGSTTTATKRLEITGDNNSGENNTLRFVDTDTTTAANQVIGKIEFYSSDATAPGGSVKAYISAHALDTSPDAYLDFATDQVTGTPTVRQRIQADGKVLFGTTTAITGNSNLVQVNGGLDHNIIMRASSGTAFTLGLNDKGSFFETTSGSAIAVTIPTNASVAFPIGTQIWFVQGGAGVPTFSGDTGVTLRTRSSVRQPYARYAEVKLTKTNTDEWYLTGDLKA